MVVVPGEVVVAVPVIGLMVVGIVALGVDGRGRVPFVPGVKPLGTEVVGPDELEGAETPLGAVTTGLVGVGLWPALVEMVLNGLDGETLPEGFPDPVRAATDGLEVGEKLLGAPPPGLDRALEGAEEGEAEPGAVPMAPDGRAPAETPLSELPLGELPLGELPAGELPAGEAPPGELPPRRATTGDVTTGLDGVERVGEMPPLPLPVGLDGRAPWDPPLGEVTTGLEGAPAPDEWLLGTTLPGLESPGWPVEALFGPVAAGLDGTRLDGIGLEGTEPPDDRLPGDPPPGLEGAVALEGTLPAPLSPEPSAAPPPDETVPPPPPAGLGVPGPLDEAPPVGVTAGLKGAEPEAAWPAALPAGLDGVAAGEALFVPGPT